MDIQFCHEQTMGEHDYDSEFSLGGRASGKPKRLNHNELERKRRHHQKERLSELKDAIPTLQMEKPSTVLIMQKAKEYIDVLKKRCDEMEHEMDRMRQALMQLTAQNQNQRALMSGYTGQEGGMEDEALRLENLELKNQLSQLEKKLSHQAKLEFQLQHGVKGVNNIGMDNNMWPAPSPIGNVSHIARHHARTASQPASHLAPFKDSNLAGKTLVSGMNAQSTIESNGMTPNGTTAANPSSGHPQIPSNDLDMSSHLRKRQSVVDHEYDNMQKGFYGRRNSTIEALEAMRGTQSYTLHSAAQVNGPASDKRNVLPSLILPMLNSVATTLHEEAYTGEEVKCRVCSGGLEGLVMLDCDRCHNWYHGQCVGVDSKNIPSSWVCNPCLHG